MMLRQSRFLRPTFEFELGDDAIVVRTKRWFSSYQFEVRYADLRDSVAEHRHFPIVPLVVGSLLALAGLYFGVGVIRADSEDVAFALAFPFVITAAPAVICWWLFLKTKVDFYIFRDRNSGQHLFYVDRWLPTERHAREFVDIVKERINAKVF